MEVNQSTLGEIAKHLEHTMSHEVATRRTAETYLGSVEGQANYSIILLKLLDEASLSMQIRMAAAITLKNFIKKYWKVSEDVEDKIVAADRISIKQHIVDLMLRSPHSLQNQLSEAVSIIGKEDFPEKWESLLPEMIAKFATGDFHLINGVLKTAHSLFKRYRHEVRSNELFTEIKHVIGNFGEPLTNLLQATMDLASHHANNPDNLKVIFSSLLLILKIFLSLNAQDLPEFFEDNMAPWMAKFHDLLKIPGLQLPGESPEDDEPGLVEQVKAQVCDNISLYASKYDEEFASYLPAFVTDVWELLLTAGQETRFDTLVSTAIQFLASVAERTQYKDLFASPDTLQMLCEKVIIPNMHFRSADEELFRDNPEEYIRRDIEGSNALTRRKAACELVKGLCRSFEGAVIGNFSRYIGHLLEEYTASPQTGWPSKDAALFLVTSLAAKGQTEKLGVTVTTDLVNITDFFGSHVLPELQNPNVNALPVIKADCIKYLMIFRGLLPPDQLRASLPLLSAFLLAESHVVHSYSAAAIDKLLLVKADNSPVITKNHISDPTQIISNCLTGLTVSGSEENEYLMRALMRSFSCLQDLVLPTMGAVIPQLIVKLQHISKNPSKPHFNHCLFETLCLCIRIACQADPSTVAHFEGALFPVFQDILHNDVTEFLPYVFQLVALLLEHHSPGEVPAPYLVLFPLLLSPVLWDRVENVPSLVRLVSAYLSRGAKHLIAENKMNSVLGIFQKLCASRANDHWGFQLLGVIMGWVPRDTLNTYMKHIFVLLFTRLQNSKTVKYMKGLIVFFGRFSLIFNPADLITMIDGIQANMFGMFMERVLLPHLADISDPHERHVTCVAWSRMACECAPLVSGQYSRFWPRLVEVLIKAVQHYGTATHQPRELSTAPFDQFADEGIQGHMSFSQLSFAGRFPLENLSQPLDHPKLALVKAIHTVAGNQSAKIRSLLSSNMPAEPFSHLQSYFAEAQLTL